MLTQRALRALAVTIACPSARYAAARLASSSADAAPIMRALASASAADDGGNANDPAAPKAAKSVDEIEGIIARKPVAYTVPNVNADDTAAVMKVLESGRLVMGEQVREFESLVATFTKREHAVATTSGTTALHLALAAQGVGPGWKVFVPAYTWLATYSVVVQLGAQPVLVDIDPLTYTLSREALVRAVDTARRAPGGSAAPMAVLPVHMFGFRAGEGWLEPVASALRLTVVGDACSAFGGLSSGVRCGAWAPVECFSFHPRKLVSTGEGGMVVCDDAALAARMRALRDHGAVRSAEQRRQTVAGGVAIPEFPEPGFNYRLTEMQGALGASQMRRIETTRDVRMRVGRTYDYLLETGPEWLRPPSLAPSGVAVAGEYEPSDVDHRVLTFYPVTLWGSRAAGVPAQLASLNEGALRRLGALERWRNRLVGELAELGVAARVPMTALSELQFVQRQCGVTARDFPNTHNVFRLTFALPNHNALTLEEMTHVVRLVTNLPSTWHSKEERNTLLLKLLAADASKAAGAAGAR